MLELRELPLEGLTPTRLWSALNEETRRLAALALYQGEWDDPAGRREADSAIAATLRFREIAVRKLPVEKRVGYLVRSVRPDDSLVSSLLLALHLGTRRPMLEAFLDGLGIPQEGGLIDPDQEAEPPDAERLADAVENLGSRFPRSDVEIYLASLLALEPERWNALTGVLERF